MRSLFFILLFTAVFALPTESLAQPTLVQCGNSVQVIDCTAPDGSPGYQILGECTFCDFLKMGQNIINFLVYALAIVATLLFMYAGILYLTAAGNQGNISKAHSIFTNVFIGLIIVLAAWLIVDIVLSVLTGKKVGPWTAPICEAVDNPCRKKNPDTGEGAINVAGGQNATCYIYKNCATLSTCADTEVCKATAQECATEYRNLAAAVQVRGCAAPLNGSGGGNGGGNNNNQCTNCEAGLTCTNCAAMAGPLGNLLKQGACELQQARGGCMIDPSMLGKLNTLASQRTDWIITEAWPPTVTHANDCHSLGTCVDAALTGITSNDARDYDGTPAADRIADFIIQSRQAGVRAVFEVKGGTGNQATVNTSITANINAALQAKGAAPLASNEQALSVPWATGAHLSIYNN